MSRQSLRRAKAHQVPWISYTNWTRLEGTHAAAPNLMTHYNPATTLPPCWPLDRPKVSIDALEVHLSAAGGGFYVHTGSRMCKLCPTLILAVSRLQSNYLPSTAAGPGCVKSSRMDPWNNLCKRLELSSCRQLAKPAPSVSDPCSQSKNQRLVISMPTIGRQYGTIVFLTNRSTGAKN